MTYRAAIDEAVTSLEPTDTPFLDALVLLAFATDDTKEHVLASMNNEVPDQCIETYRKLIERRRKGVPVSYLRGVKEFFGIEFTVDQRVLVPRPDSEILVEAALETINSTGAQSVHDCCTGTGCIALAIKSERSDLSVSVSDISKDALTVCRLNCRRTGYEDIVLYESDLLAHVPGTFDVITANPPYLSAEEVGAMKKVGWPEPEHALLGGETGTEIPERLIQESLDSLGKDGYLLIEAAESQIPGLRFHMESVGYTDVCVFKDLAGRKRVLRGTAGVL